MLWKVSNLDWGSEYEWRQKIQVYQEQNGETRSVCIMVDRKRHEIHSWNERC